MIDVTVKHNGVDLLARIRELEAALAEMNERQRKEWARAEQAESERDEAVELLRMEVDCCGACKGVTRDFLARTGGEK